MVAMMQVEDDGDVMSAWGWRGSYLMEAGS